jgi:pimeloyl-ACP methyl ester carboxylesterase
MYLARGEPIRDFIADAVTAIDGRVVLVAHSLGGIASVELLATRTLPAVELLVTVGSQAPFLYELNALPTLAFGAELPATVPRWVNIFDRRDLLAFAGAGVFPGRVEDREVDNGTPFPRSHSAYFANSRFYAALDEVLP